MDALRRPYNSLALNYLHLPFNQVNRDQFSYLREILRKPHDGEKQIQGTLLGVKCEGKGLVFVVKTDTETLRLFTQSFEEMTITTYTRQLLVTLLRRSKRQRIGGCSFGQSSTAKLKVNGTIKSIEFVPEKFKLNAN